MNLGTSALSDCPTLFTVEGPILLLVMNNLVLMKWFIHQVLGREMKAQRSQAFYSCWDVVDCTWQRGI